MKFTIVTYILCIYLINDALTHVLRRLLFNLANQNIFTELAIIVTLYTVLLTNHVCKVLGRVVEVS